MVNKKQVKIYHYPLLKPATETISIRFPRWLLDEIKAKALGMDVAYQSLIKVYLADKLAEIKRKNSATIKQ